MTQQFDIGVHHYLRQEWRMAATAFREVLREAPQDARGWSYLGACLSHLGEGGEAEFALSRAVALAPQDGEAWFHLGVARSLREEWESAASAYRHAVALLPQDLTAWHRLGVALAESGEREGAETAFERALVLSRETGEAMPETPVIPAETGDVHLAEAAEREDSREGDSWLTLALSLLSLGDEEEAMAAYERAYTIDPERAERSLFRPMLQLLNAAGGRPIDEEPEAEPEPPTPQRPWPRPPDRRPEVA
ncbi:MAG TPA: tetratricopeptide repeat protein [Thermoplasmata archaeon]|nr:tetratricopeptide repeat protein [Thermoplasmata archaeon]